MSANLDIYVYSYRLITDAATWEIATENMNELYFERPPLEDFLVWRDDR